MWIRKIVTGTVFVVVSGSAVAQGAFEFDEIPGEEPALVVDFNPVMLSFFRAMITETHPEGAALLGGLRSIKMRVYSNVDDTRRFNNFIADVTEDLEDQGWMPVVSAQDEEGGSNVRVHMQMNADEVLGMTFMVNDGSEAFFINIDGTLTAADLGRIMALPPVQQALGSMGLPGGAVPGFSRPPPPTSPPQTNPVP